MPWAAQASPWYGPMRNSADRIISLRKFAGEEMGDQAIIRFSRHAKRRAKLYGISESTVRQLLE
jgi:hypothetical protein